MIQQVIVTNAFFEHGEQVLLHPALANVEKSLLAMQQSVSSLENQTPLSWMAVHLHVSPAALLAACLQDKTQAYQQFWVVSPYHAQLTRSSLRVMPDAMLDFSAQQAQQIYEILNPFLLDDGLHLHRLGASLLLCSERVWDVAPTSFANVSGQMLPDRLPAGKDAGAWMRLMSELQMMLHQKPVITSRGLAVHGLWCWGESAYIDDIDIQDVPNIATRHTALNSVLSAWDKQRDATVIVTEAEHLAELLSEKAALPKSWCLMGAGKQVMLKASVISACLAKLRAQTWKGIE